MADPSSRPQRNIDGSYSEEFVQHILKMLDKKNEQITSITERVLQLELLNKKTTTI
jgi:hypothetical protein